MGNQGDVDSVYCFDAKTGRQIWKKSYPCPTQPKNCEGGPNATPTVADSAVYTISRMGQVFCRKTDNGDLVWSKNLPDELGMKIPNWGFAGSPLVLGKLVILNAGTAGLALDKDTGKVVWQNGEQDGGYATPVPYTQSGTKCLAIFNKDSLVGVKLADGAELWKFPWRTGYDVNAADPVICSDGVFISSGYGKGCAMVKIDGEKPVELWNNKDMRNHFSSCVLVQRHLYGFDESQLKCLDTKDGKPTWSQSGLGKGSLAAADDKLIILSEKGKLVVAKASPEKFDVLAEAQILAGRCWTVPVLSDGLLYARNAAGDVVCVDLKGQ
jgi:outer membrane protein assembly factor BamB